MAEGHATRSSRGDRTICVPDSEDAYTRAVNDPAEFRRLLDERFETTPELFPPDFARGYQFKEERLSVKQGIPIRRIVSRDGSAYSIRPSFLNVFGHDATYWYRLEGSLGRFSIVGTIVRQAELPEHLLADEHHQPCDGEKLYIATRVADEPGLSETKLHGGPRSRRRGNSADMLTDLTAHCGPRRVVRRDKCRLAERSRAAAW
jgi:hypothetical protein